ncbi:MAG: ORF6N domain-containing protein [Bacteroides sp.]|nr:ORF6N domain-containing protein [Bacteroides sp.]
MDTQVIQNKIYEIRGQRVMLDFDLAELYGIETKNLKKAVRRNLERFPSDFMFELNNSEFNSLKNSMKFQNGTSRQGGIAYAPFAFTEQGVAMLSSVLRSTTAIEINIRIMRAFVAVRQYLYANQQMSQEIENLKHRLKVLEQGSEDTLEAINDLSEDTRRELDDIYLALSQLADKPKDSDKTTGRKPIGFREYK